MTFFHSGGWKRSAFVVSALAISGAASALNYDVQFTNSAPTIDGTVDAAWASASAAATGFVQHNSPATVSTEQTSVRSLWSPTHLFILFEAQDTNTVAPATADYVGFDFGTPQDTAEIFLDPSLVLTSTASGNDKMYHIAVDPKVDTFTYTEAGQNQTSWKLSSASDLAFASSSGGWTIEMAIAWSDLNSSQSLSPGQILGPPPTGTKWGAQFGRLHGGEGNGSTIASKWEPTSGAFRTRPFGTLTFVGGPAPVAPDLSGKTVTYTTGFEAPTYTAGSTANGIDGWSTASPNAFNISNSVVKSGTQSLQGVPGTGASLINTKRSDNTTTPQYLQYAVRLPQDTAGNGYRTVLYINGNYGNPSAPSNGVAAQIWFNQSQTAGANTIDVYNYENADGSSTTTATGIRFPGLQAYDNWMYVTSKIDPVTNTYEVWINDIKLVRPDGKEYFSVRNKDTFLQFTFQQFYNKNYGTEPVYFDDLTYAEDPPLAGIDDWQLF